MFVLVGNTACDERDRTTIVVLIVSAGAPTITFVYCYVYDMLGRVDVLGDSS